MIIKTSHQKGYETGRKSNKNLESSMSVMVLTWLKAELLKKTPII